MSRVLVVEDEAILRRDLVETLKGAALEVDEAPGGEEALAALRSHKYDLVVTDLKMPGVGGMEILREARQQDPDTEVIIVTAFGSLEATIEAMKLGAFDYIQKPFGTPELVMKVQKALHQKALKNEVNYLRHARDLVYRIDDIIGVSPAIKEVLKIVRKVAPSNASILITGETGTGKELIAGAVHYNSPRASRSFVKVNCAALPEGLLESELFGHEKGAFTGAMSQRVGRFEQANGGTIFLDEVGDMSPATQAKMLRVLEERQFERVGGNRTVTVDVRVLAATNKDLAWEIKEGRFREDLYFRLNVVNIHVPALRDRKEDIPLLTAYFLKRFRRELKREIKGLSNEAMDKITRYDWPGNVRELENTLERGVLIMEGDLLGPQDLILPGEQLSPSQALRAGPDGLLLKQMEKEAVLEALKKTNFIQKDAAKLLGISKRVMHYKVTQFGIKHPRWLKNK